MTEDKNADLALGPMADQPVTQEMLRQALPWFILKCDFEKSLAISQRFSMSPGFSKEEIAKLKANK